RNVLAILVLAACGNGSSKDVTSELAPPPPVGRLEGDVEETATALHVHYAGRAVPLRDLPIAAQLGGIPMSGAADIAIDLTVPKAGARTDFRGAIGEIDVGCPKGCTIGDDVAKLKVPAWARGL